MNIKLSLQLREDEVLKDNPSNVPEGGGEKVACATLIRGLRMAQATDKTGSALG